MGSEKSRTIYKQSEERHVRRVFPLYVVLILLAARIVFCLNKNYIK